MNPHEPRLNNSIPLSGWTGLRHLHQLDHDDELTRMHLELLKVLASKRKMDLFEIASLLNIGHISAAEMVDTLIEKGLVENKNGAEVKIRRGTPARSHTKGFVPVKSVIREESRESEYSMLSMRHLKPKASRK